MIDVTCAVIRQHSRFLATRRSTGMPHPLKWEFPGGKVKSDETPEQCLIREIGEELGIGVEVLDALTPVVRNTGTRTIRLLPFLCRMPEEPIVLREHQEYRWISCKELDSVDWLEADLEVVAQIRRAYCQ